MAFKPFNLVEPAHGVHVEVIFGICGLLLYYGALLLSGQPA